METRNNDSHLYSDMSMTREKRPSPFKTTFMERWGTLYSAVAGYIYMVSICEPQGKYWMIIFTALFCLGAEWVFRRDSANRESYIWLACLWLILICGVFGPNRVWGELTWLFIHGFGLYWAILRSGRCTLERTSRYLPVDVLYGGIIYPFKHIFLRLKVFRSIILSNRNGSENSKRAACFGTIVAILISTGLFCMAVGLLSAADSNFERLLSGLAGMLARLQGGVFVTYFLLSLPVGAYLFGVTCGINREPKTASHARENAIQSKIVALRRVPASAWSILLGAFSAIYLLFIVLQGGYLFSALFGVLPDGFTASHYARQGFFELCWIMALNFVLLFIVSISGERGLRRGKAPKIMGTILLGESILFAVTAASKLFLYIQRFGFTPLRLQSAWLISVLLMGCVATLWALWTGRDTVRSWALFAGISLALLHLY